MRLPFVSVVVVAAVAILCIPTFADRKQSKAENEEIIIVKEISKAEASKVSTRIISKTCNTSLETDDFSYQSPYDFDSLQQENTDIKAWIEIPGTNIDYPILFDGTDRYLHMNLGKKNSVSGSIYLDATTGNLLNEKINIIYGHHMKNGTMFADIDQYSNKVFWNEHKNLNIYTEDREINLHPVLCVVGESDASLRTIASIDDMKAFCNTKTVTQGEFQKEWKDLYVFVTCNYTGNNYRTYLFCTK